MLFKTKKNKLDIVPFAKCPLCSHLIKMKSFTDAVLEGSRDCPFCHSFIEKREIIASCELYLKTTKALQIAGNISNINWVLVIVFGMVFIVMAMTYLDRNTGITVLSLLLTLIISNLMLIGGFLAIQNWLGVFSFVRTNDNEFIAVREKMRRSRIIWLLANIVNLVLWFIFIKFI
jgi:hypothetical protein